MELYGVAYRIKNSISGKCYIGVTTKFAEQRFQGHIYDAAGRSNRLLHKAMRKYGIASFAVEPIASSWSKDDLFSLERELIKQQMTLVPNGYNLNEGGSGHLVEHDAASRENISKGLLDIGHVPWNKGKKGLQIAWNKGTRLSRAHCASLSVAQRGKERPWRIKCFLTVNGETLSAKQWSEKTGIKAETVRSRMRKGWSAERILNLK